MRALAALISLLVAGVAHSQAPDLKDDLGRTMESWKGVTLLPDGRKGACASFQDPGGTIDLGACPVSSDSSFTLKLSIRTRMSKFATILMARKGGAVGISLTLGRAPGKIAFEAWSWESVKLVSSRRIDDGEWHDVEVRYDADGLAAALFLDGRLEAVRRIGPGQSPEAELRLGNNVGTHQPFHGDLDELWIKPGIEPTEAFGILAADAGIEDRSELLARLRGRDRRRLPAVLDATERRGALARMKDRRLRVADALGLLPEPPRTELDATCHGHVLGDGYRVERWTWATFPSERASGDLYLPDPMPEGRRPSVLNPHGHWGGGGRDPVVTARARHFARSGTLALVVDSVHIEDLASGVSSVGVMTWNNMRAIDLLVSRQDVDPTRIAVTGASGGAQQTMYLMALEPRLAAAAPICMISGFHEILDDRSAHCWCNHAPRIGFVSDPAEMCALFAPRPAFFGSVSGDWTKNFPKDDWPGLERFYRNFEAPNALEASHLDAGHNYDRPFREAVYRFFNKHLGEAFCLPVESEARPVRFDQRTMGFVPPRLDQRRLSAEATSRRPRFSSLSEAAPALPWRVRPHALEPAEAKAATSKGWRPFRAVPAASSDQRLMPRLSFLMRERRQDLPCVLVVSEAGKAGLVLESPEWLSELDRVLVADPRFLGEWQAESQGWIRNGILLGRSEAYEMAHDLANLASSVPGDRPVRLLALGWTAPAGLLAATLCPRIEMVVAPNLGKAYSEDGNRRPVAAEILRYGDLDRLIADLAKDRRSLRLGGVSPPILEKIRSLSGVEAEAEPLSESRIPSALAALPPR